MKKPLFILLLLAACTIAQAQDFDFYAIGGPVVSQVDGDRIGGYDKLGAVAGIGVAHAFVSPWRGIMELEYIQKGKGSFNESSGETTKTTLHYIQLPVLAEYTILENVALETGFSFGYLMKYQFYQDGQPTDHSYYTPRTFELDYLFGGSYTINELWKVNLRFAYSIIPIGVTSDEEIFRTTIWRNPYGRYNRSVALAFQYWF